MSEIRAFVGHSFVSADSDVVGKFLKYFGQLTNLLSNFSWQHAEAAEPKILTQKVLQLIADKNVFIGICTKKEHAIEPSALKPILFGGGALKANPNDLQWKTSDWIIQEIGLAVGKGMSLILLMEDGVRKPGGLQSDVEYISFERSHPERSFGKILEMISALSPKSVSLSSVALDEVSSAAPKEDREASPPSDDSWKAPKVDWKRREYEFALMNMILNQDSDGIANIDQAFRASGVAAEGDNIATWNAFSEYYRLTWAQGGSLANLKTLATAHSDNADVLKYLALGYIEYQDHDAAAIAYQAAASKTPSAGQKLHFLGRAALEYARAGKRKISSQLVNSMKDEVEKSGSGESELLTTIREVAKTSDKDDVVVSAMERLSELNPDDTDNRFELAYKHSESGNIDLALMHYLAIPVHDRSSTTWNNLGVAFDQCEMPAKSVEAYRRAKEANETLAMSNLAIKFMSAGFIKEAEQECDSALKIADYHKNIPSTLAKLKRVEEEENKTQDKLLEKAKPRSKFYQTFGRAFGLKSPSAVAQKWMGPDCPLNVKISGSKFVAEGVYERKQTGLLAISSWDPFSPASESDRPPLKYLVKYEGTVDGRSITAQVTRRKENDPPATVLGSADDTHRVLMVVSDGNDRISAMEFRRGETPRFYNFLPQP